jgi:hypothetical protein
VEVLGVSGATDDARVQFADLMGDAVLVRVTGRTVVLRGDGPIEGFDPGLLSR